MNHAEQERRKSLMKSYRSNLRRSIEARIQCIKEDVELLLQDLPYEQQHLGSECQVIESAASALYDKYIKRDKAWKALEAKYAKPEQAEGE